MKYRLDAVTVGINLVLAILVGASIAWLLGYSAWGYLATIMYIFVISVLFSPIADELIKWGRKKD